MSVCVELFIRCDTQLSCWPSASVKEGDDVHLSRLAHHLRGGCSADRRWRWGERVGWATLRRQLRRWSCGCADEGVCVCVCDDNAEVARRHRAEGERREVEQNILLLASLDGCEVREWKEERFHFMACKPVDK